MKDKRLCKNLFRQGCCGSSAVVRYPRLPPPPPPQIRNCPFAACLTSHILICKEALLKVDSRRSGRTVPPHKADNSCNLFVHNSSITLFVYIPTSVLEWWAAQKSYATGRGRPSPKSRSRKRTKTLTAPLLLARSLILIYVMSHCCPCPERLAPLPTHGVA